MDRRGNASANTHCAHDTSQRRAIATCGVRFRSRPTHLQECAGLTVRRMGTTPLSGIRGAARYAGVSAKMPKSYVFTYTYGRRRRDGDRRQRTRWSGRRFRRSDISTSTCRHRPAVRTPCHATPREHEGHRHQPRKNRRAANARDISATTKTQFASARHRRYCGEREQNHYEKNIFQNAPKRHFFGSSTISNLTKASLGHGATGLSNAQRRVS